jgi:hypothetical protein
MLLVQNHSRLRKGMQERHCCYMRSIHYKNIPLSSIRDVNVNITTSCPNKKCDKFKRVYLPHRLSAFYSILQVCTNNTKNNIIMYKISSDSVFSNARYGDFNGRNKKSRLQAAATTLDATSLVTTTSRQLVAGGRF